MWYNRIVENLAEIPSAIDYYNSELDSAKNEPKISGKLEKNSQELSGITSHRFGQLQEIEAILKHLNIKYDKMRSDHYRKYLERYQRDLTDRSIEKYIDGEDDIVNMNMIINEVGLVRNKYLALMKGLEIKNWQISNIVRLRVVGMEDANLDTKGG
jgi:hypothetical protein